jgi:hypothetical protein
MYKKTLYILFLIIVIISCVNTKNNVSPEQTETAVQPEEPDGTTVAERGIRAIDIKSPNFFWLLQPWKDGKLATIDGWGRFAEISFEKNNRIRIKHLINFPRRQLDGLFMTWPDADLLWVETGQMQCVADVRNKKSKAFVPLLSWTYNSRPPLLLDKTEGLILFSYDISGKQKFFRHIYYNYLRDEIVSDTGQNQPLNFCWALDREWVLVDDFSQSYPNRKDEGFIDFYIYNRITGEKIRNKFTDTVTTLQVPSINLTEHGAMSWGRRYLISDCDAKGYDEGDFKISWNEDFSKVEVLPIREILRQLLSNQSYYYATYFVLSPGGEWATANVGGYRGLYNERLKKRVFYHMDDKYPGGMSMPILSEEYEGDEPERAFVNHPEYGMCFAQEWHKEENGKDQLYLRLYKMSDVLAEINRQLLEKANEALR